MAERFFSKVANDVLQASEQLSARLEDGLTSMFSQQQQGGAPSTSDPGFAAGDMMFDEDFEESPLLGIAESVVGEILKGQGDYGPKTAREHFDAFRSAIRWTEPFIISLLTFQIVMFIACVWASRAGRNLTPRVIIMVIVGVLVRCAERLNMAAAARWQQFCTQNYFDERGVFISIFLSAPLLFDSLFMLLSFVVETAHLLVQVKTAELKKTRQQQQQQSQPTGKTGNRRAKKDQ